MSVKKEPNGRRSAEVAVEVPGTPEEVWQAIATGPGISSWFVPTMFEERDGKIVAVKVSIAPGVEFSSPITAWDPPRKWAAQSDGMPGSPPIANEWIVEARGGGVCVLRIVQSLFASTDDWDNQLEGAAHGWPGFFRTLQVYLTHFRGQRSALKQLMIPFSGTEAEAWEALTTALRLKGVNIGQRWAAPAGTPNLSGIVEYLHQNPNDALLRIDAPSPGVAAFGTVSFGGPTMIAMNLYLYGDLAAEALVRETPLWEEWLQKSFSMPAE